MNSIYIVGIMFVMQMNGVHLTASITNLEFLLKQWYVITALQNAKSVPPVTGF